MGALYRRPVIQYLEVISFRVIMPPHGSLGSANAIYSSRPAIAFASLLRTNSVSDTSEICNCRKDSRAEKTRRPVRPRGFLYLAQYGGTGLAAIRRTTYGRRKRTRQDSK